MVLLLYISIDACPCVHCGPPMCKALCKSSGKYDCVNCCTCCVYFETKIGKRSDSYINDKYGFTPRDLLAVRSPDAAENYALQSGIGKRAEDSLTGVVGNDDMNVMMKSDNRRNQFPAQHGIEVGTGSMAEVLADVSAAIEAAEQLKKTKHQHGSVGMGRKNGDEDLAVALEPAQQMSLRLDILKMSENRMDDYEQWRQPDLWRGKRALDSRLSQSNTVMDNNDQGLDGMDGEQSESDMMDANHDDLLLNTQLLHHGK